MEAASLSSSVPAGKLGAAKVVYAGAFHAFSPPRLACPTGTGTERPMSSTFVVIGSVLVRYILGL
jgi:hypothetical protein